MYFDGLLPPQKRPVRISRLESYLTQLIKFHSDYPNGLRVEPSTLKPVTITSKDLFDVARPVTKQLRGLSASPFLVPAIMDTLSISKYADVMQVVHGEADSFCAYQAFEHGGIVMTSDSDLLVYDLGMQGGVAFFNQIEIQNHNESKCHVIAAPLFRPHEIAKKLSIDSISCLAFKLKADPSITLREAARRSKKPLTEEDSLSYSRFMIEYAASIDNLQAGLPHCESCVSRNQLLDPRISEFVLQCLSAVENVVHMYLPFLIDDPSRLSAWDVASSLRCFSYSILIHAGTGGDLPLIHEYGRRGYRVASTKVETLNLSQIIEYAKSMNSRLTAIKASLGSASSTVFWKCFGLSILISWYYDNGRKLPNVNDISNMLYRNGAKKVTWEIIQLSAQFQAVTYSLRLAKHILHYLLCKTSYALGVHLVELCRALNNLPLLNELCPSPLEMQTKFEPAVEIPRIYELVVNMVSQDDPSDPMERIDQKPNSNDKEEVLFDFDWQEVTSKRARSRVGKVRFSDGKRTVLRTIAKTNIYNILAR